MATRSSILAWKIPQTEEPGGLQSMGLQRIRHNEWLSTQSTHSISAFWCLFSVEAGRPYFIMLCFIVLHRYWVFFFFFNELKVFSNPKLNKPINTIFPTIFAHFASLCHIFLILAKFKTLKLLWSLLWWPAISDLWHSCCNYRCSGKSKRTRSGAWRCDWIAVISR